MSQDSCEFRHDSVSPTPECVQSRRNFPLNIFVKSIVLLILVSFALPVRAQELVPEQIVFPITDFKPDIKHLAPFSIKFGTGFCLDPNCRFVGTNYHVAKLMGSYVRIKRVFSAHRYLDSSPNDVGAQDTGFTGGGSLKYSPTHDLAIYEMRRPLEGLHGIRYDTHDLQNSSEADIYAYPFEGNPKRALARWHGKFIGKTREGLLAFRYEEGSLRGGASGGIVVDSRTKKMVGILSELGTDNNRIALAVPVKELSDFVTRAQPYLQATIFPRTVFISPIAADLYPPYIGPRAEGLSQRTAEPAEVVRLRRTAQHLADSMRNFIAIQTFAWGRNNGEPEATDAYETLIVDGSQRWRRPGTKKIYNEVPLPPLNGFIVPGAEWSDLPAMVGTQLDLKIQQAQDAVVVGRTVHVFQYSAKSQDRVCGFKYFTALGFVHGSTRFYDCHGEVWTDEAGVILRISEALDLSGPWYHWWGVMTYGWLEKDGTRYLVPVTITTQAEHKNTYWCRGLFTDYQMFDVKARMVLPPAQEADQKSALGAQ